MSTVDTMDPTTFAVPSGQALLYAEVSGNETLYKYKLSSGTTGAVTTAILAALGVKEANLPVLVYQADLLNCLNESFASISDLTIATSTKASLEYVKKTAATKVNKSDYLTRMAQTPTFSDMEMSLSAKADSSDVQSSLEGKADASAVYSKDETNTLISEALAGKSAVVDQTTLEGDGTADSPLSIATSVMTQITEADSAKHTHSNITVLNKFSEDASGNPLYNGAVITGGGGGGTGIAAVVTDATLTGNGTTETPLGIASTITESISVFEDFKSTAETTISTHTNKIASIQESLFIVEGLTGLHTTAIAALEELTGSHTASITILDEKAHTHAIDVSDIDAAAILVNQHAGQFPAPDCGRLKSFDPGKIVSDPNTVGYVYLDFNYATRWKVDNTVSGVMIPRNFVDGAEAYIVLYAGATPHWDCFTDASAYSTEDGVNAFDNLIWVGDVPEPESYATGFTLVKLMVVDNVCIAEAVASTLA